MEVAIVHDYLTQPGGAERVVLSMRRAFPTAPLHTSLYRAETTFPEFRQAPIETLPLNRVAALRRNHRLALPFLGWAFSRRCVSADLVLCSSSGWAHGVRTEGRKVVYCYTPARWLYDGDRYLGGRRALAAATLALAGPPLRRWDQRAARTADRYLAISRTVRDRIWRTYGIEAEVVPPPLTVNSDSDRAPVDGLDAGFLLCVARLLPYKNVGAAVEAFRELPHLRLVVVGDGPLRRQLVTDAPPNVTFLGTVGDRQLRWLYSSCQGVVAAGYEDYGLTPLEAASFGRPSAALRWGGYLDTVVEGETGVFFDDPDPGRIRRAVEALVGESWTEGALRVRAEQYSEDRFIARLRQIVIEEASAAN